MSTNKPKKKVVKIVPTASKTVATPSNSTGAVASEQLLFNRTNYIIILAGFGLILLGMILMMGGNMPSPDVWDEDLIYSFRRTVLAPFVILVGLVVGGYGIFKK